MKLKKLWTEDFIESERKLTNWKIDPKTLHKQYLDGKYKRDWDREDRIKRYETCIVRIPEDENTVKGRKAIFREHIYIFSNQCNVGTSEECEMIIKCQFLNSLF